MVINNKAQLINFIGKKKGKKKNKTGDDLSGLYLVLA